MSSHERPRRLLDRLREWLGTQLVGSTVEAPTRSEGATLDPMSQAGRFLANNSLVPRKSLDETVTTYYPTNTEYRPANAEGSWEKTLHKDDVSGAPGTLVLFITHGRSAVRVLRLDSTEGNGPVRATEFIIDDPYSDSPSLTHTQESTMIHPSERGVLSFEGLDADVIKVVTPYETGPRGNMNESVVDAIAASEIALREFGMARQVMGIIAAQERLAVDTP